jgi:hypothetical protein
LLISYLNLGSRSPVLIVLDGFVAGAVFFSDITQPLLLRIGYRVYPESKPEIKRL